MSIVIRGMEMPENCGMCDLAHRNFDGNETRLACYALRKWAEESGDVRLPDCPLVALPEKHGRLIDGDALRSSFRESIDECYTWAEECDSSTLMYARVSQSMGTFVEASLRTKAQPTVLEAEGKE